MELVKEVTIKLYTYRVISKYSLFAVVFSFKTCIISPARFLPLIRTISLSAQTEHLGVFVHNNLQALASNRVVPIKME
jgi:hypothetical protein